MASAEPAAAAHDASSANDRKASRGMQFLRQQHVSQEPNSFTPNLLNCTFSLFMPIWKPFMAWMAVWALEGLSKLTKPEQNEGNQTQTSANSCIIHGEEKRSK
ncbi:hypothetical protein EYF80_029791 [Liparis tanakae]|uniref:Uncharacterized protein n=1 Tax=Liparis tanakae TaxID=230148 RepID=A0A4Z2H2E6_9TELE|nr:hypothetical protein EYF80_029791 [Liparis tanakae]